MTFALLSGAYDLSYESRAYGIVCGCAGVALVAWQFAAEEGASILRRRLALVLLAAALSGALLAHCFAVLLYIPIAASELCRTWKKRRIDAALWATVAVSLAPLVLYSALFAANREVIRPLFLCCESQEIPGGLCDADPAPARSIGYSFRAAGGIRIPEKAQAGGNHE